MLEHNDRPATAGNGSGPLVAAVVLVVLVLVLAIQNSERLGLHLLFWNLSMPAYGLVAMSALLGAAMALSLAGLWRRRRRIHQDDRHELDRLRGKRHRRAPDLESPAS